MKFRYVAFIFILVGVCSMALGKTGPTLRSTDEIARLREQARTTDWGKRQVDSLLKHSIGSYTSLTIAECRDKPEQFFWDLMYTTKIPRNYYVHDRWQEPKGCPIHGTAIFKPGSGQLGAWSFDHDNHPWKLKCPIGGEYYPSNDFANGDMTSGDYPDNGSGWEHDGSTYYFIQVYAHYLYLGLIRPAVNNLASAYELTGDPEIGRRGAILLCKIAQEWPNSTTKRDRTYHPGYGNGAGMITDCDWSPGDFGAFMEAYDQLYTAYDDPKCLAFLQQVHPEFKSATDVRRYIENELIRAGAQATFDHVIQGNHGAAELALARAALVLDDYSDVHPNSKDIMHWVYYTAPGQVRYLAANLLLKDGGTTESPSYNTARLAFVPLLKLVDRIQKLHPDQFPQDRYPLLFKDPKFRAMFDYFTDMVCIEKYMPAIGDMGSAPGKPTQTTSLNYGYLGSYSLDAFAQYGDTKFAQAAYYTGALPTGEGMDVDQALVARAREQALAAGPHIQRESQIMDGYKLAFLRDGEKDDQWDLWTFYGSPLTHGHNDPLTIGLYAKGVDLLPGIGYPQSWKDAGAWESHILTANTVCVDRQGGEGYEGRLLGMARTPAAQWLQLDKDDVSAGVDLYRRTLVSVKLNARDGYLVDLFDVHGGSEHHLAYHGPQAEVTTQGLDLQTQPKGTLAGENIEFNQPYSDSNTTPYRDPFCLLTHVQRATPAASWSLDWAAQDQRDVHLCLHGVPQPGSEVILADGSGATHPEAYSVKFALQHNTGQAPLSSQFLTVLEPYEKQPFITKVERLALPQGNSRVAALQVTTTQGVDTLIFSDDPNQQIVLPDGTHFRGRFGLLRRSGNAVTAMSLVGGTELVGEGVTLTTAEPLATGKIIALDRQAQSVDVDWQCSEPAALLGRIVRFHNERRTAVYTVTAARKIPDGTRLTLNTTSLIGEGAMTSADDYIIHNSANFFYAELGVNTDGTTVPAYRLYVGATLENEDGSRTLPIEGITGGGYWGSPGDVYVDRKLAPEAKAESLRQILQDTNGDGLLSFRIYDYGVGDSFEMPHAVGCSLTGASGGGSRLMTMETTAPVDLSLSR